MFKLATSDFYREKIKVHVPQGLGKHTVVSFVAHFKHLARDRIEDVVRELQSGDLTESALLREVVVGFEEVQDEDGHPLEYSDPARDKLLNIAYVHSAVMTAFLDSLNGKQGGRKNS